jgi:Ni,Fe-hydrogenase I cytochrome b subunit
MSVTFLEVLPAVLELLAYSIGSLVLSGAGFYIETTAYNTLIGGETTLGLWLGFVGAIALYAGLRLARDNLSSTFRSVQAAVGGAN